MARETLIDFFGDLAAAAGEFLVYDDGYRVWRYSYRSVAGAARGFAARLQDAGLLKGDAVLFWSENRPEWIAAFWGCILSGVVVVPVDYRSSPEFARRVASIAGARLALIGSEISDPGPTKGAGRSALLPGVETWRFSEFDWHDRRVPSAVPTAKDDLAEVMFTSGATADPKGVVITHRNLLANIVPIEREVNKYRAWGRPFFPLRFLNLLPLSHLFGQAMATFIPPMLPGTVVFMHGYNPGEIARQVKLRRVSVIVCVPKILEMLRSYVGTTPRLPGADASARQVPAPLRTAATVLRVARRWWRYRAVHGAFGVKFWSFVVGAAPLDPSLEEFWSRLGFLVIQGYGLTETAPIVSLNHPFSARKGSVGKAIGGIEVRIAPDGEILVRGENVTRGYFGNDAGSEQAFENGWLHTGDIGELDESGQLFVRGRKKEMIVTPDGLNVFPEDVERVLDALPGVRESAVVGVRRDGCEHVHAVLVAAPGTDVEKVISTANAALADHQRIRGATRWPGEELPRTEGTRKLKRRAVRDWVERGAGPAPPLPAGESVESVLARFAHGRTLTPDTTFDELGLTSLDKVEMMVALEQRMGAPVDESIVAGARTVGEVEALAKANAAGVSPPHANLPAMPGWNRRLPARWFRNASLAAWVLPLARVFVRLRVEGLEHLQELDGPVVFAANHQSHLDTPSIYAALPRRWRYHVAVAMAKEFFAPHFHPVGHPWRSRAWSGFLYRLAALYFNAFPLPQREAGARGALRYIGDLVSEGWSVLIYPEGERTADGAIGRFRPGVGMIAARLSVPVVPVRLEGLQRVLHRSWRMARPGVVRVAFGAPLILTGEDYATLAADVEEVVRRL